MHCFPSLNATQKAVVHSKLTKISALLSECKIKDLWQNFKERKY
jgi:hypothetical protein